MSENLVSSILGSLSGDTVERLAGVVGANPQLAQAGLASAVPALLGGLLGKGSTTSGASDLLDMLGRGNYENHLSNLGALLSGGSATSDLLSQGANLVGNLFGKRGDAVSQLISQVSGLSPGATNSMMSALAPLAMGFFGRHLRSSGGLNLASLARLLGAQAPHIKAAAPAGLGAALGFDNWDDVTRRVSHLADAPAQPITPPREPESSSGLGWVKWVIVAIAVALLFSLLRSCQRTPVATAPVVTPAPVVDPAPVSDGLVELALPDGSVIRIAADGAEARLLDFLADGNQPVSDTAWFTMDRLEFETGSATVRASSAAQLDNVASILRAYPAASLKFGGYTDNTGDPAANLALSESRARAAMQEIVNRGIGSERLAAEGYGEQFPLADNATDEGRQRNRRVDLRVTAK